MNSQEKAFEKLSKLKVGALFMEMGTGKTKVALDLMAFKSGKTDYNLWICPVSLKNEIEAERSKWHPDLKLHIYGCESIGSSDRIYLDLLNEIEGKKVFCVVDESLKIKNYSTKRTKRILNIGKKCEYRMILNGTPVSKSVMDLWSQMEFLSPKILGMSEREFKDKFCEYYIRGKLKGLVKRTYNTEYLISLIEPYIFDSELDLDIGARYEDIFYSNIFDEEYQQIKRRYIQNIEFGNFDFFSFCTELQRCYTKSYGEHLNKLIEEIDGQVIVYVKFLDNIPFGQRRITGEESLNERKEILSDFENKKFRVLFMTYGVGSYGLNLQFCNNIIFADQTFDYSQKIQAEHRIYRLGQQSDVHYYNLFCSCGVDKLIRLSLTKKTTLLEEIKREIEQKGEEAWLKSI